MNKPSSPDELMSTLGDDRKPVITELRKTINKNLPKGFEETVSYGMLCWVVPHKSYPDGYHCDPKQPLPFLSLASQKSHIALYHMGLYSSPELMEWFTAEWPKHSPKKLDMGKSCIRFKKPEEVPVELVGQLVSKMSPKDWIALYESQKPASK